MNEALRSYRREYGLGKEPVLIYKSMCKAAALGAAQKTFCSECQEGALLKAVACALAQPVAFV
jgi:hypothetical protein